MREQTYSTLTHPEWVDGNRLWKDPSVTDLIDRLHNGDPTRGWEGDPRLAIYYIAQTKQWELMRLEADGEYRRVAVSKPGVPLSPTIIDELVARDVRRGFNLAETVNQSNDRIKRARSAEYQEWLNEEIRPHMSHLVGKGRIHRGS